MKAKSLKHARKSNGEILSMTVFATRMSDGCINYQEQHKQLEEDRKLEIEKTFDKNRASNVEEQIKATIQEKIEDIINSYLSNEEQGVIDNIDEQSIADDTYQIIEREVKRFK